MIPDYTFTNAPRIDYLAIPDENMPTVNQMIKQSSTNNFIKRFRNNESTKLVSTYTSAYLLANIGFLKNKKATTHYFVANDFEQLFNDAELIKNVRYVDEGRVITSLGVTSGIDVALYIVGQNSGIG